jgi:membrane-associated phospholipid phosphatase
MSPRAFPSAALWACLGLVAIADVVAMAAGGFRLVGYGALWITAVSAGAWSLGYFYSTARPDERLAALAFAAAYLILFTFSAGTLSYVGTSLNRPLLDSAFAHADAALGLDWMATLVFTDSRPVFGKILRFAYQSSLMQIVAVVIFLSVSGQLIRLRGFLALFTASGLVTIVASIFFPAAGAFVFHNPPAELRDVVGHDAGIWHIVHFEALRSGAMRAIDPSAIEGLITFPSFHTALAVITTWAFWRTRYLALPVLVLNVVVVASTVPVGGHYFVDIAAGAFIAATCVVAMTTQPWRGAAAGFGRAMARPELARIGVLLTQKFAR